MKVTSKKTVVATIICELEESESADLAKIAEASGTSEEDALRLAIVSFLKSKGVQTPVMRAS